MFSSHNRACPQVLSFRSRACLCLQVFTKGENEYKGTTPLNFKLLAQYPLDAKKKLALVRTLICR